MRLRVVVICGGLAVALLVAGIAMVGRRRESGEHQKPAVSPAASIGEERPARSEKPEARAAATASGLDRDPKGAFLRLLDAMRGRDREEIRHALDELMAALKGAPVSDSENAAVLFREALDLESGREPWLSYDTPEERAAAIKEWLEKNRQTLELLHQAADRPKCDFGVDLSKGDSSRLLAGLHRMSQLLGYEAEFADGGALVQAVRASNRLAEAVGDEPDLLWQMIKISMYGVGEESVRRALAREMDEGSLREIVEMLSPDRVQGAFERALLGDICSVARAAIEPDNPFVVPLEYLQTMEDVLRLWGHPYIEIKNDLDWISRTASKSGANDLFDPHDLLMGWGSLLAAEAESQARAEARSGVLQLGAALKLYQKRQGIYPTSLYELQSILPSLPVDPFTGEACRYRQDGDGFVVYSVGRNCRDDGGQPESDDVVFRLAR